MGSVVGGKVPIDTTVGIGSAADRWTTVGVTVAVDPQAAAGRIDLAVSVDQLEGHLDSVRIGLVENELDIPLQRFGRGIDLPRVSWVGDLFHTDDNLHGFLSHSPGGNSVALKATALTSETVT